EASDRMAAFRTVNLAHIARDVAELFDAAAEERGGHLGVVAGQEGLVTGDRGLLFDAVANLIDNAIQPGRRGGGVTEEGRHGKRPPPHVASPRTARDPRSPKPGRSSRPSPGGSAAAANPATVSA